MIRYFTFDTFGAVLVCGNVEGQSRYIGLSGCAGVPKTRSGKIMRRILRKIASKQESEIGDTSTLADPSVVDQLLETRGK